MGKGNQISNLACSDIKVTQLLQSQDRGLCIALDDQNVAWSLSLDEKTDKQKLMQLQNDKCSLLAMRNNFQTSEISCTTFLSNSVLAFIDISNTLYQYSIETQSILNQLKLHSQQAITCLYFAPLSNQIMLLAVPSATQETLLFLNASNLDTNTAMNLNEKIRLYTENNDQAEFPISKVLSIIEITKDDMYAVAFISQVILVSQYYETVIKIIYLERISSMSSFLVIDNILYLATLSQHLKEFNVYNILSLENHQCQEGDQLDLEGIEEQRNDLSDEDEKVEDQEDLINEFAKKYEENKGNDIIIEQPEEDDESQMMQQSFRNMSIYNDISRQMVESSRGKSQDDVGISCLRSFVPQPKSVFLLANQKIEIDSIYDSTDNYNKTRFSSNLPQKYSKTSKIHFSILTDLPVTFHKKIKSSGYGGQPSSLKYSKTQKQKAAQPQPLFAVTKNFYSKPLPMAIPDELACLRDNPLHKNAVTRVRYSPLGTKLAAVSQDTTVSVIKTPVFQNQMELTSLGGHNAQVNSINFSANDQYLLSASSDKTCIIWNLKWSKKGEKLLILDRLKKNKTSQENPQNQAMLQQQNPILPDIVRGAQFYFDDKLLVLSCGNQLLFYQYELPDHPDASIAKDDVKRLQQKGLYKLLQTYTHPTAQHIPSFSFHNHRLKSNIGLIGGSNKELIVHDANTNQAISTLNDGHQKHIHTVKFYEGSYGDAEAYNTFLTASTDNCIKLWDLRVGSPVRDYIGFHQNRALQIGFEISNCYRYLISGSEDRSVYIYDIGSGELVNSYQFNFQVDRTKNSQHGDSVTDIAVNPVYYEWATSCIDGHVRIFRYPAYKIPQKPKPKTGGGGLQVKGKKATITQQQLERDSY